MSLLEIGHTGASKQSWRSPGPRALLKKLMDESKDPHDGKVLFKDFLAAALPAVVRAAFENEDDERRLVNIIEYWFTNNHNSMIQLYPRPGDEKRKAVAKKIQVEKEEKIRTALREKIKEQAELILLDWIMPNGKAMGDCTGKEIRQFGRKVSPWLAKVAERVQPTEIVRDVLSETDVRKMWGK
jgi:hypothetical protein